MITHGGVLGTTPTLAAGVAPVLERGVGGLAAARGGQEARGRGEELVDGIGERREGHLGDMERFEYDPFLSGALVSFAPLPPVVGYLFCALSFSLGRFLS